MIFKIQGQFPINFLKKIKFNILKRIFFLFSLSYFCIYFLKNLNQISFDIDFKKNGIDIFLSFLFCIISVYFNAFAWKKIVMWFGKIDSKNYLISFYVITNILKYVPGGIWHFYERFNFIKRFSSPQLAFYSTLVEPYFMLCASFLCASLGIIFSPFYLLFVLPLLFLNRKLIYLILRRLESLKKKVSETLKINNSNFQFDEKITLNSFFPTQALLLEIGFILSKFIGFLICMNIVDSDNNYKILYLLVIFCISWSIGLVIPTAPSGVGVFEASFVFLSANTLPQPLIFVSLIYFRLITTSADLLLSFPFLLKKLLNRI